MRALIVSVLLAAFALLGFWLGRTWDRAPGPPGLPSAVLASFEGGVVTAVDLEAAIAEGGPETHQRARTSEGARTVLDETLGRALLAKAARDAAYDTEPMIKARVEDLLARAYRERSIEPEVQKATETDVRTAFETERPRLAVPERIRVATIFLAADDQNRSARQIEARKLLDDARKGLAKSPEAFANLARLKSEDTSTRDLGGQLPFLTREELEQRLGAEVAEAAFALTDIGAIADRPIAAPGGFHLVRLLGREPARAPVFEHYAPRIRERLLEERRRAKEQEAIAALRTAASVRIDEAELARFVGAYKDGPGPRM